MQFVHPEVLWALSALTIPVLVHLFSFRRHRKVAFSQTAFLKEVRMESRSRNRIRNWLVLLMRLLAVACIILAFAEPMRQSETGGQQDGQKRVSLYIDTSPSMDLEGRNGPMLDAARNGALALVESHAASDRFHVVTSSFDPGDRKWLNKDEAIDRLSRLQPGNAAPVIQDVLLHQQSMLSEEGDPKSSKHAYLFTDLQASSHVLQGASDGIADSSISVRFITQQPQPQVNVRIDSVWFDTPMRLVGRSEVLHVRISHDARSPVDDLPLGLNINGRKAAIGSFRVTPGLPTDTVLRFRHEKSGPVHAVVSTSDAPVTFDDRFHFGYTVDEHVDVLLVQGRSASPLEQVALGRLFGDASLHNVTFMEATALDYSALETADLIVLQGVENPSNGLIASLLLGVEGGKSLLMLPPAENAGPGWNELLLGLGANGLGAWREAPNPVRLGTLHSDHPLFEGVFARSPRRVDLPSVRGWYSRSRKGSLERNLLSFSDDQPFLTTGLSGLGRYHFCAGPLDAEWSNLAQHALLVPIALRMAETSRTSGLRQFTAGEKTTFLVQGLQRSPETQLSLAPEGNATEERSLLESIAVPGGLEVSLPNRVLPPGNYVLEQKTSLSGGMDTTSVILTLGINPSREESELATWDPQDWKQALITEGWRNSEVISADVEELVEEVEVLEAGQPLWLTLIILALLFLILEMVLLKRTSAMRKTESTG